MVYWPSRQVMLLVLPIIYIIIYQDIQTRLEDWTQSEGSFDPLHTFHTLPRKRGARLVHMLSLVVLVCNPLKYLGILKSVFAKRSMYETCLCTLLLKNKFLIALKNLMKCVDIFVKTVLIYICDAAC